MTAYELADQLVAVLNSANTVFMNTVAIIAGFLLIGLYFGQLLDRVMTGLLVAGYSALCLSSIGQSNRAYTTFRNIAFEVRERAAEGQDLGWSAVNTAPAWFLDLAPIFPALILLFAWGASLVFFFRIRKLDPKEFGR